MAGRQTVLYPSRRPVYKGKEYTAYEATQRQRKLETTMRAERSQIKLLQEGGALEDDIINARAKYRVTSSEYVDFSKAMGLPQQRARVTVDGLGNVGVGKWKVDLHKKDDKKGEYDSILDKLMPNKTMEDKILKQRFDDDLSVLPQKHIDILENTIQNVIISTDKPSGYNSKLKTLRVKQDFSKGHMVHEVGHVIADYYKVYDDDIFISLLRQFSFNRSAIVEDTTTFVEPVYRINSDKFISLYQGALSQTRGIIDDEKVNVFSLREYFSEGFREFFENPKNLKNKDTKLFEYIKELLNK